MDKQKMLQLKIELALAKTATDVLLYVNKKLSWSEVVERMGKTQQDLYTTIAGLEPTNESEVL